MTDTSPQSTAALSRPPSRDLQRAAVMRVLQEELLREREAEERGSAVLSSFIGGLRDAEWQLVQDRMVEPMSRAQLAQESSRITGIVSELLLPPLSPPSSGPGPVEDVQRLCEEAVRLALTRLLLPPPSWGLGRAVRVQSSQTSAARFSESTALYDSIVSQLARVAGQLVMSGVGRSSESHDGKANRSENTAGFFRTVAKRLRGQWRKMKSSRDRDSGPSADSEDKTASRFEGVQQMKKLVFHFLQTLPAKLEKSICDNAPSHWQATTLFPV